MTWSKFLCLSSFVTQNHCNCHMSTVYLYSCVVCLSYVYCISVPHVLYCLVVVYHKFVLSVHVVCLCCLFVLYVWFKSTINVWCLFMLYICFVCFCCIFVLYFLHSVCADKNLYIILYLLLQHTCILKWSKTNCKLLYTKTNNRTHIFPVLLLTIMCHNCKPTHIFMERSDFLSQRLCFVKILISESHGDEEHNTQIITEASILKKCLPSLKVSQPKMVMKKYFWKQRWPLPTLRNILRE